MKKLMFLPIVLAAGLSAAHAADLTVSAAGLRGDQGTLYFALFEKDGFLDKPVAIAKSTPGKPVAVLQNLPAGTYAVSVYQDVNNNGKLDRNMVGAPLEPYGVSNDAMGMMGPPAFDAAAIQVGAGNQSIVIKLH